MTSLLRRLFWLLLPPLLMAADWLTVPDPLVEEARKTLEGGDAEGALSRLEMADDDVRSNPRYQFNRGVVLHKLKRHEEARDAFLKAIDERDPIFKSRNYHNLGVNAEKLGKPEEAIEHYRRALEADWTNPGARRNLERLLAMIKKKKEEDERRAREQQNAPSNDQQQAHAGDPQQQNPANATDPEKQPDQQQQQPPEQQPQGQPKDDPQNPDKGGNSPKPGEGDPKNPGEQQQEGPKEGQDDQGRRQGEQQAGQQSGQGGEQPKPEDWNDAGKHDAEANMRELRELLGADPDKPLDKETLGRLEKTRDMLNALREREKLQKKGRLMLPSVKSPGQAVEKDW
ncbi:MAG: hypothetical protein GMKNLPBB_01794 [Myxococcota bacterium]|nr:hypothetical protein [Myxococcota bacterium]